MRGLILAALLTVFSSNSIAQEAEPQPLATAGSSFLLACNIMVANINNPESEWNLSSAYFSGLCMGAINGIAGTNSIYQKLLRGKALFCPPANVNPLQIAELIVKHKLEEWPERLHDDPVGMTVMVMAIEFPCYESTQDAVKRVQRYEGMNTYETL